MDPVDVMEMLNDYFAILTSVIFKYGGTIDKCAGDTIIAVFGSPESDPHQRENAIHAALEWHAAVTKLNDCAARKELLALPSVLEFTAVRLCKDSSAPRTAWSSR